MPRADPGRPAVEPGGVGRRGSTVDGAENSSNASPGPAANPMGKRLRPGRRYRLPDRSGTSGRARLGSNQEATVCRSVGPPARSNRPDAANPAPDRLRRSAVAGRGRAGAGAGGLAAGVRLLGRLEPGVQVALQEGLAERRQQVAVDPVRVAEPDLDLGRVDVDVDLLGRDVQVEERHRHPARPSAGRDTPRSARGSSDRSRTYRPPRKRNCPLAVDRLCDGWAT